MLKGGAGHVGAGMCHERDFGNSAGTERSEIIDENLAILRADSYSETVVHEVE